MTSKGLARASGGQLLLSPPADRRMPPPGPVSSLNRQVTVSRRDEVLQDRIAPLAADIAARPCAMSLVANGACSLGTQLHTLALRVLSRKPPSLVLGPLRCLARALLGPPTLLRFGLRPSTHDRHPLPHRGTCGAGGPGTNPRLPSRCWRPAPEPPANGPCSMERVTFLPRVKRHARAALVFFMTASWPSRATREGGRASALTCRGGAA